MPFSTVCPPEPGVLLWFGAIVGYLFLWGLVVAGICSFMLGRKP